MLVHDIDLQHSKRLYSVLCLYSNDIHVLLLTRSCAVKQYWLVPRSTLKNYVPYLCNVAALEGLTNVAPGCCCIGQHWLFIHITWRVSGNGEYNLWVGTIHSHCYYFIVLKQRRNVPQPYKLPLNFDFFWCRHLKTWNKKPKNQFQTARWHSCRQAEDHVSLCRMMSRRRCS